MTLGRQLALGVSALFFAALVGVQWIHLRSAQASLQQQLEALAQDAATSIGLSLGNTMRENDRALIETVINPAFDRGHYQRIEYFSAAGDLLASRTLPPQEGRYPGWFVTLFPLHGPTAQSLVSAGWRQLGRVQVTAHPKFAYEQLWATARDTLLYLALIYVAAMLALRFFLRGILRPLAEVERAAQAMSARHFVRLKIRPRTRELARVVEAMNALSLKVNEVIEGEAHRAEHLLNAAYRDEVTGLLNGRGFAARFESAYEGARGAFDGTLAFIDLADLAAISREIGAGRCDALLRGLSGQIGELAAAHGGFAGRWTGALTVLALPKLGADAARDRLAALRERLSSALRDAGLPQLDHVYCGAVIAHGAPATLRQLIRAAEEALLRAHESEEDIAVLAAGDLQGLYPAGRADLLELVREALGARRVLLAGQGAYRMSDHRPLHTEIMARLRAGDGEEVTAAEFLPVVVAHGLAEALDRAVIGRVLEAARGRRGESISVNVSIRSAEQAPFVEWLAGELGRDQALARRLVFEISEHGVAQNEAAAGDFAGRLARCGARFAIDHFGVQKDSLARMQHLRPAYLKLAATHTPNLLFDTGARFFAESLIRAARQLDIPVIAQNVEDDQMFQALVPLGFTGYQGNLMSPPVPWPR